MLLIFGLACLPASWIPSERREPPTAQPTEVVDRTIEAKAADAKVRKSWKDRMHGRAPGVDWKGIEAENGRDRIARRTALRQAPPPDGAPDDGDRWTERGSENQAGRTHVARESTDGALLYVGAAAGGLWRRESDGVWTPLGDGLFGGVHWLELLPDPAGGPDVLVTGTDGGYLYRSEDDGQTWQEGSGLESGLQQRRVALTSDGAGTLYAVRRSPEGYAAWRSDDGAATWQRIADLGGCAGDLSVSRTGGSTVWLAGCTGLQRSDDRGETWEAVGTWFAGNSVDLAACEGWTGAGGLPRFYVVIDGRTLWRSDDGGTTFVEGALLGDYWGSLVASIVDPNLVVYGGVELHKSQDGGEAFTVQSAWSEYHEDAEGRLHADIMGVDVFPDGGGGERWYLNTDGGTFLSADNLSSVQNLSLRGLRVSQYYGTLTSSRDPAHIAAGAQDQGYQLSNGQPTTGHLYDFEQAISGDYAHLTSGDGSHDLVYSVYPDFVLIQVGEEAPEVTWAEFPDDARAMAWLPVLLADPDDPESFWLGGDRLWRYERKRRWEWKDALASDTDFASSEGEYISALAFSPLDHDRMYAVTSSGRFFRSDDRGANWSAAATDLPAGQYFYGNAIAASALDRDTVYVGGSGYSNEPLWVSRDGGDSFESFSTGLPLTMVYALVEEPGSGTLFAGTETSAWRRLPGAGEWEDITGVTAPLLVYWSVELVPAAGIVRFGTYGRGVWDYAYDTDLDGCLDEVDADGDGTLCPEDCDDLDAASFPGATDTCGDGIDQDCDGGDRTCPEDTGRAAGADASGGGPDCGCGGGEPAAVGAAFAVAALLRRRGQPT